MDDLRLSIKSFEKCNKLIHIYPLSEKQMKHIEDVLNDEFYKQAIDEVDWMINFASATIYIESDPSGYYLKLYHNIDRISKIERVRLGDCEEYQIKDNDSDNDNNGSFNDEKLTEQEQRFAEEHHDLIYNFLRYRGLDKDKYYDVIALGYLKGVKDYNRKKSARRFEFVHIANRAMNDAFLKDYIAERTHKRKINLEALSLNAEITTDGKPCELADFVPDTRNYFEEFEDNDTIKVIIEKCTEPQRQIIKMLVDVVSKSRIQQACGIGRKAFESEMDAIKGIVGFALT